MCDCVVDGVLNDSHSCSAIVDTILLRLRGRIPQ